MASSSKNITIYSNNGQGYTLTSSFNENSKNIDNNKSSVTCSGTLKSNGASWVSSYDSWLKIYWHDNKENYDREVAAISLKSLGNNASATASGTIDVTHKDDGTLEGFAYVTFTKGGTSAYTPNNSSLATDWTKLTTIARTSKPTLSKSELDLGETIKINTNRNSSSFTHKLYYSIGSRENIKIAESIDNSYDWLVPKEIANEVPNSDNGIIKFKLVTYNGIKEIGSKEIDLKIKIPNTEEFNPIISSVKLKEAGDVPETVGEFIQGISKITGDITATGIYGSSIKSYSISLNNETFNSSTFTTSYITLVNPQIKVSVTDSRGRTANYENIVNVLEYNVPTITNYACYRNSVNPAMIDINFSCSIYTLNEKNTKKFVFYYRKTSDQNYSSKIINLENVTTNILGNVVICSASFSVLDSDVDISYNTYLEAIDLFKNIKSINVFVNTMFKLINISSDKKDIAIGKLHEKEGFVEIAKKQINYDKMYIKSGEYEGILLNSSSIENGRIEHTVEKKALELSLEGINYYIPLFLDEENLGKAECGEGYIKYNNGLLIQYGEKIFDYVPFDKDYYSQFHTPQDQNLHVVFPIEFKKIYQCHLQVDCNATVGYATREYATTKHTQKICVIGIRNHTDSRDIKINYFAFGTWK